MGEWKALKKASGTAWKELERESGSGGWKALKWYFLYEDDFEDGTIGNCPVDWTCDNGVNSHFKIIAGKSAKLTHNSADGQKTNYRSIPSFSNDNDRIIRLKVTPRKASDYTYLEFHNTAGHANSGIFLALRSGYFAYYCGGWSNLKAFSADTEYDFKIYNIDFTNNQFDIDIDEVNEGTNLGFYAGISTIGYIVIAGGGSETCENDWDDITLEST